MALAVFLGPQLLAFALLGPFVLLVTAVTDRWGTGRARHRDREAHVRAVAAAHARLDLALAEESARLHRVHPDPHTVLVLAESRLAPLWSDGPTTRVRLGLGDVPTRVTWVDGPDRSQPPARGVPVVVDLDDVGGLAVVGPPEVTDRLLAGLVGQLCTAHPPSELAVTVDAPDPSWDWVGRLPHVVGAPDLLGAGGATTRRVMVAPRGEARGRAVAARARVEGALVLAAVRDAADVPAGCRAVLSRSDAHDWYVLDTGSDRQPVTLDLVGSWWTDRLSRALAPLREVGGSGSGAALPRLVTLPEALGVPGITVEHVLERWKGASARRRHAGGGSPSAAVGVTASGAPHRLDLARDGPHVLVGGTTGSGKSEFLCTLVTSLAVSAPPEELTFVLVDFKGGAAFSPCAALPHVVGLVTDLDEHLVDRALSSLRAELRRRERLFARVGARDLADHRRLCGPDDEPVPRLVVVIDELRALVDEVPHFVSGLVRLAALGRSLGVHLVLATQRPSGALTAEIQANVNLRIAFRVRDRADSVDVLEDPAAAGISPSTPGRALARGGDGELVRFQAATMNAPAHPGGRSLTVRPVGSRRNDADAGPFAAGPTPDVVEVVREAHRLRGGVAPRSPWLPPLPDHLPWCAPSAGGGAPAEGRSRGRRRARPPARLTAALGPLGRHVGSHGPPAQWPDHRAALPRPVGRVDARPGPAARPRRRPVGHVVRRRRAPARRRADRRRRPARSRRPRHPPARRGGTSNPALAVGRWSPGRPRCHRRVGAARRRPPTG